MKKGLIITTIIILAIVVVGVIGTDIMPVFDGAMPRPGG